MTCSTPAIHPHFLSLQSLVSLPPDPSIPQTSPVTARAPQGAPKAHADDRGAGEPFHHLIERHQSTTPEGGTE
eukprot:3544559-Pyramimonas_sp.AAC.1